MRHLELIVQGVIFLETKLARDVASPFRLPFLRIVLRFLPEAIAFFFARTLVLLRERCPRCDNLPNSTSILVLCCCFQRLYLKPVYWQASQSGSSNEHACGTGAGWATWSEPEETAFSEPVSMVDFSVPVAASERR